ncbi:cytochrome P450 9e2-like isoform X1 [Cephus cinctus]|uniref:Cytochrome P450 9e2-like isoform X1 n=1 Tax=Cephus cinctus TaxID=211228 RepID=A0AAJ7FNC5_CEPCN|nr:cytochrome P450 9e2-like isoform X1 [Cephus cinctus]
MAALFLNWLNFTTVGILVGFITVLYIYVKRHQNYFETMGIPYVNSHIIVGNRGPVIFKQMSYSEHIQSLYGSKPDVKYFGIYDFTSPAIMIRDLELIRDIGIKHFDHFVDHKRFSDPELDPLFTKNLFALNGDKWREMRALLSPAFTSSKMKVMFDLISTCATDFVDIVMKQEPIVLDIKDAFTRYTNDVIASVAFGISVNSMKDRENEFCKMGKEATHFGFMQSFKLFLFQTCPTLVRILKLRFLDQRVTNYFTEIISSTIATRTAQGIHRPDMLQLMMQANESGKNLTVEEITAQAFLFFFAGFDTTSRALSFAAYALATNPEIQEKLQAEIDKVLQKCDGKVTYDYLKEMQYLDAVLNETLRMYPATSELDRMCTKAFELPLAKAGAKSVIIKPGTTVLIPINGIHYDSRYYDNPNKFDPERFLNVNKIGQTAHLSFGLGPRVCIGNRFALMEIKLVLFHLLAQCSFKPCEKTTIPMKFRTGNFVPIPINGHWLKIVLKK